MHHAVDDVRGLAVRGGLGRLDAAALVDADVNDDRAAFHTTDQVTADEAWRSPAGDQHRADDQVGQHGVTLDRVRVGVNGHDISGHDVVEISQAIEVDIHDDDVGAKSGCDSGGG